MGAGLHEFEAGDNRQNAGMGYSGPMPYGSPGSGSLFRIFWRGKWLILLSVIAGLSGAFLYLRRATPMYQSTSRVLVDKPRPLVRLDVPIPVGSTSENYLATQASVMTSPEIVSAALRDPNLLGLPRFADRGYVASLVGTLTADAGRKADIIQITASSPHPQDAAQIVNAVVRAYIQWHDDNRALSTGELLKDLNRQLEQRLDELTRKRQARLLFEQRNPGVVERARGDVTSKSLGLLKDDLVAAQLATIQQNSYYERLVKLASEPNEFRQYVYGPLASVMAAVDDGERNRAADVLTKTRLQLEELSAGGAAQRSQLAMLQEREKQLIQRIAAIDKEFVQRCLAVAQAAKEDAGTREQLLTKRYDTELEKVQNVSMQDSEYSLIISECQTLESLYNSLLTQINSLDLNAQLESLKIHVLQEAMPASAPSSPQPTWIMGVGLMLGLLLGGGLSLLWDRQDQRLRSADEITALLGAPILGAVPSMSRRALAQDRKLQAASHSSGSEACRSIRTALLYGVPQEQSRTILVTSPGPLEGKTTLVNSLAAVMAQAGQKTLIMDADLRKPAQQRPSSDNGSAVGLTDVLTGTASLDQAIRPTETDGLKVLASGRPASNPAELLNSPAFATVLERLQGQYDRILVDSPPVAMVTDAQILATLCGSTLLVLRAEKSSRILTQRARDALLAVGVRVTGAVVNDVPKNAGKHTYYGGYGYYHPHQGSNGHKAARQEPSTGAAAGSDQGTSSTGTNESKGEASPSGQQDEGGPRPTDRAVPLEIKEYDGKAKRKAPRPDRGSRRDRGTPNGETKE